jgi:hypothetical protein
MAGSRASRRLTAAAKAEADCPTLVRYLMATARLTMVAADRPMRVMESARAPKSGVPHIHIPMTLEGIYSFS